MSVVRPFEGFTWAIVFIGLRKTHLYVPGIYIYICTYSRIWLTTRQTEHLECGVLNLHPAGDAARRRNRKERKIKTLKTHTHTHLSCFVETHVCKLCVMLRSRVLRVLHDLMNGHFIPCCEGTNSDRCGTQRVRHTCCSMNNIESFFLPNDTSFIPSVRPHSSSITLEIQILWSHRLLLWLPNDTSFIPSVRPDSSSVTLEIQILWS